MNTNGPPQGWIDVVLFRRNQDQFPAEQLVPYWGKQVAWSPDGTRILVSGETVEEVYDRLKEAGIHFSQVVMGYVDDPNTVQL